MTAILNKDKLNNLTSEIWKSAERLRGKFKAYEYQSVILPIIVIRRLECVLISWREKQAAEILEKRPDIKEAALKKLVKDLEMNPAKAPFSNKTNWTLKAICDEDPTLMEKNFRDYLNGFSKNIQDIIENFDYRAVIGKMVKNARLSPIIRQYSTEELGPDNLSNLEMGYVYEELLRRFSEQSGEEAGEHFTPREVIRLMVDLLGIPLPKRHLSIYDPACGTGGMLSIAKEHLLDKAKTDKEKNDVEKYVTVHGHELQPGNYAICKSDMLIKNDQQAEICYGNSLIPDLKQSNEPGDQLAGPEHKFDFMLSNPPFGVTWGGKDGYEKEARRFESTRYKAGMPRTNDGALLFLQTMLAKMKPAEQGGSRIAIIFNGSPLSNGDCGSGESEIRRWILENDWLDAIIMLPDQLFYNTGIYTYIWLLTNNKSKSRKQHVRFIDARKYFGKEPKSFGNKRNRIADTHRKDIANLYRKENVDTAKDDIVKIFKTTDFAYHKVSVVFWQTDENDKPAYVTEPYTKTFTPANIKKEQEFYESDIDFRIALKIDVVNREIRFILRPEDNFSKVYEKEVKKVFKKELDDLTKDIETAREKNNVIDMFIKELDVTIEYTHRHYIADYEYIQYGEDIEEFLKREIAKPIIRWQDSPQLGYEILPNKYFYKYQPPMPADELLKEFWELEKKAEEMRVGLGGEDYKSIIHKAVTRGLDDAVEFKDSGVEWLGRIPKHWKVKRIKDIVSLKSGDSITAETIAPSGDYPVFGGNGLRGFTTSYTHDGNYILIGRQGALCGNINYAEGQFWASEHAVVATNLIKNDILWLGELLRVMNLNQYSNAAAQPGLAVDKIKFLKLPLPPYEEQQLIASFIRDKINKNKELTDNLQAQISTLEQYRKSLIHECVTGKRRITEDDIKGMNE